MILKCRITSSNLKLTGTAPQQNKQVKGCQKYKKYHRNRSGLCPVELLVRTCKALPSINQR